MHQRHLHRSGCGKSDRRVIRFWVAQNYWQIRSDIPRSPPPGAIKKFVAPVALATESQMEWHHHGVDAFLEIRDVFIRRKPQIACQSGRMVTRRSRGFARQCYASRMRSPDIPERAMRCLELYIDLGPNRSLERLSYACKDAGIKASLPTLKRWSKRYGWQAYVQNHERARCAAIESDIYSKMQEDIRTDIAAIEAAKSRFRERVLLDPNDPTLSRAQRRRALCPTLNDYIKILKLERVLYASIVSESPPSRTLQCTPEELDAMVQALATVRYGLPPNE